MPRALRALVALTTVSILVPSAVAAQRHSTAQLTARDVLLTSAEAIGGVERLRALRGVRVEETGGEHLVSTRTRRDAPAKRIVQSIVTHRSGADDAIRRTTTQTLPMRAGRVTTILVANREAVAVVRN